MSRAGCSYDNTLIERYFNTLKHELITFWIYRVSESETAVAEFAYAWYNRILAHTFNGGLSPAKASGLILYNGITILLDHVTTSRLKSS